ncbi:MAG: rod shape-determining protein MreC [Euzebya sp.]
MNRRRTLIGALVLLALAFITLDFRETGGPVGALQRGSDAVFDPIQGGFATIVRPVGDFFGSILEIGSLRGRIQGLEADNEELRANLQVQADLERRLREAEELLNMSAQQDLQLVGARVIAAPPGTFERSIVIDVGAASGIAPEMVVINSRGVVGLVVEVTASRARVNLLSSTEGGLGVRIAQTGDRGLLTGQGSALLQLEMVDSDPRVPLDAVIVTESFQGSLIPGGIPVGALELPPDGDPQGERFLEVRPYVDFSALSTVAVVVAGREEGGQFGEGEIIQTGPLAPIPRVTVVPDPNAAAVPGVDFPAPPTLEPSVAPSGATPSASSTQDSG